MKKKMDSDLKQYKLSRWYFGGLASSGAACFTHPLDLLKVTLQTQQKGKLTALQLTGKIIRERGIFALYNGLSASLLRQITYSTTRFGLYEIGKQDFGNSFLGKVMLAGISGAAGGNNNNKKKTLNYSFLIETKTKKKRKTYRIDYISFFWFSFLMMIMIEVVILKANAFSNRFIAHGNVNRKKSILDRIAT